MKPAKMITYRDVKGFDIDAALIGLAEISKDDAKKVKQSSQY